MDPFSIVASSASVASLCVKTVYTLAKWGQEVTGIDTLLAGLRGEIESVQSVVTSLDAAIKGSPSGTASFFRNVRSGTTLWSQVALSLRDLELVLKALDKIIGKLDTGRTGIFRKMTRTFKANLESAEIVTLRQRLVLITSALNLPMHMLSL
jgi:hypothetical protein